MAANSLTAPAPGAGLEALWCEHLHHRAASRARRRELASLAASLAPLLRARQFSDPIAYPAWLASVAIPAATANRLTAPDKTPPPSSFTLANLQLTLTLSPSEAAVAHRALPLLAALPGGFDPAAAVTNTFLANTFGDIRDHLRWLRQRDPQSFDPRACAALKVEYTPTPTPQPSVPPPAPCAGRSAEPSGVPRRSMDADVTSLYSRYVAARRAHRLEARELSLRLPALGSLLASKHAELATEGCASRFSAWLRHNHIPRRTAYRLIQKVASPNCAELSLPPTPQPPAPEAKSLTLGPRSLSIRLTPQQTAIAHRALSAWLDCRPPAPYVLRLPNLLLSAFLDLLPSAASAPLNRLWWSHLPPKPIYKNQQLTSTP